MRKIDSNDNLIPDNDNNLNNITYYSNSNASTKYDDSNINSSILKLSKHVRKNINSAKKDFDNFLRGMENFKIVEHSKISSENYAETEKEIDKETETEIEFENI